MSGAAWFRTGSADPWHGTYDGEDPFPKPRAGQDTFQGNLYGGEPALSPLDFVIEREWLDDAACVGMAELFERTATARGNSATALEAKAVCAGCPVRKVCLADAMEQETGPASFRWGIRGGLTTGERGRLWREQQAT